MTSRSRKSSPYDASIKYNSLEGVCKRPAGADEENTLGLFKKADLVGKMTDAFEAWAGMFTPPPKAADHTVKALVQSYLDNGGEVHTFDAYQTTPDSKIKFKGSLHPEWAGGTGIRPEMRSKKKLFMVRSKISSVQLGNTL
jgi:hypothetical protein